MTIMGWCLGCRRIKRIRWAGHRLAAKGVPAGYCQACDDAGRGHP